MSKSKTCVFCEIIDGTAPATVVTRGHSHISIVPLNPHAPGHVLFIPKQHVKDATENLAVTADVMEAASAYAAGLGASNILTSVGRAATQTVMHLHVHVIPRGEHDKLDEDWPWMRESA